MWEEGWWVIQDVAVTPCEGRVSRNILRRYGQNLTVVTPCEGRVSRNIKDKDDAAKEARHALRGACE